MDLFGRKAKEKVEVLAPYCNSLQRQLKDMEAERESLHKRLIEAHAEIQGLDNISIRQNEEMIRMTVEREEMRQKIRAMTEKVGMYEDQMQDADLLKKIISHKEKKIIELQEELASERGRADALTDACADSMDSGWQPVPEADMLGAGFTKTETGWKVSE